MKSLYIILIAVLIAPGVFAQQEEKEKKSDTTRFNLPKKEVIIVDRNDTIKIFKKKKSEGHWAGIDFGVNMLMDGNFSNSFSDYPYWKTDPAKSFVWNLNVMEHKFQIAKHYFGITTGLGFNFTSIGFKDDYVLNYTVDTLNAFIDTLNHYSTNKLKAAYLTVPLFLEFNTKADSDKSFYFLAGVVGGVRIGSRLQLKSEVNGEKYVQKQKGTFGLNAFKLDAVVRMGYSHWGVYASYSLLPLFDTGRTTAVYPLNFGLSLNL